LPLAASAGVGFGASNAFAKAGAAEARRRREPQGLVQRLIRSRSCSTTSCRVARKGMSLFDLAEFCAQQNFDRSTRRSY